MGQLTLSINPTYYCNFRCDFCYLTEKQLSDRQLLPLNQLAVLLDEITSEHNIEMVDLYGGELGLLPKEYWNDLINLLNLYKIDDINLVTNLSALNEITTDERVYTSVSYDFTAREDSDRVFKNMALLNKPFSILMLASPELIKLDVDQMVNVLNSLNNLESVEIKPYSSNQANSLDIHYEEYEEFVKKWILNSNKKFRLTNELLLDDVIAKTRNAFSDDHLYITPNGKIGVLEFDLNDNEYFKEYDSLDDYNEWCKLEKQRVENNVFCSNCNYYGNCLSEHLREVKNLDYSCNGFIGLITWYSNIKQP